MKVRFQADADLHQMIVTALLRREPSVALQTATAAGLAGLSDLHVLAHTAMERRVLTGARVYEAETYCIKGTLLLRQAVSDAAQAEACFQQALAIAAARKPNPGNCALPPAWPVYGRPKTSARGPTTC